MSRICLRMAFLPLYFVTVFITCLGGSTQFYNYGVVNPAEHVLLDWLNTTFVERYGVLLSSSQMDLVWSVVVSSLSIGSIVGAVLNKTFAELFGRRRALWLNGALSVIGASLQIVAKLQASPEALVVGRFLLGCTVGLSSGLVPIYLMEITPQRWRGAAATAHQVAVAFSDLVSLTLSLPELLGGPELWQYAFAFSGLSAFALCVVLPFCPESPKYTLSTTKNLGVTRKALERLVDSEEADRMLAVFEAEITIAVSGSHAGSLWELFTDPKLRLPLAVSAWMMVAQQFTGCAVVFQFSTELFVSAQLSPDVARYSTTLIGVVFFLFALLAVFVIERIGRRFLSMFQMSVVTVSLALMIVFTWMQQTYPPHDVTATSSITSYGTIVALIVYMAGYGVGSSIPWMIAGEVFPTKFRSSAVSVTTCIVWSLLFLISIAYLPLKQAVGLPLSLLPFLVVSALSILFIYFMLPETKDRHCGEIVNDIYLRRKRLSRGRLVDDDDEAGNGGGLLKPLLPAATALPHHHHHNGTAKANAKWPPNVDYIEKAAAIRNGLRRNGAVQPITVY